MANFVAFECLGFDLGSGKHDFANHTLRYYLSNATPNVNTHIGKANLAEITAANGYNNTALPGQNWTRSANVCTLASNNDVVLTAAAGNFGPFRYVVVYNDNDANKALVNYWDYGSSISCNNGESFTIDIPANGTLANLTVPSA
jgi:hypothetical protein